MTLKHKHEPCMSICGHKTRERMVSNGRGRGDGAGGELGVEEGVRREGKGRYALRVWSGKKAGGSPAPRLHSRFPPSFHVREAVFMVFNADLPPALQPPFCFLLVLLCKSVLQALRASVSPREFFPPVRLPIPLRPWRTWRESFFRSPSAMARQDAAPPEVTRKLLKKHRGALGSCGFQARGGM